MPLSIFLSLTAMAVFGWDKGDIAFLAMWGGLVSVCVCIPFAGAMDKYGKYQRHTQVK